MRLVDVIVLIVLAAVGVLVLAFSLTPRRDEEHYKVACVSNLKIIYSYAMNYSDKTGTRSFPIAASPTPRAHESLNELIQFDPAGLMPQLFVCPSSDDEPAPAGQSGLFTVTAKTLSYAWVGTETKNTAWNRPLASDKYVDGFRDEEGEHAGHRGGMNVLKTDNSIEWVTEDELPKPTLLPAGLIR